MYSSVFDALGFRKEKDKSRGDINREEGKVYQDINRMESDDYFYENGSNYETQFVPPPPPEAAVEAAAGLEVENSAAVDGRGGQYSQQEQRDWQQLLQQRNIQLSNNHSSSHESSNGWGSHNNDDGQHHNDANSNATSKRRIVTVMGYCDMIEEGGNGGVPIGRVPFAAGDNNNTGTGTGRQMDVHTNSRHFRFKRQKKTYDMNEDIDEDRVMHDEQLNSHSLQLGRSEAFADKSSSNRSNSATTLHKYTMPNSDIANSYHQNSNYQRLDGIFVAPPPNPNTPQHPPNTPLPLSFGSAFASTTAAPTVSITSGISATTTTTTTAAASTHSSYSATSTPSLTDFSSYGSNNVNGNSNSSRRWCPGSGEEWDPAVNGGSGRGGSGSGTVRAGGNGYGVTTDERHHDDDSSMHVDDDEPSYNFFDDHRQR